MTPTPLRVTLAAALFGACAPQSVEAVESPVCDTSATPACESSGGAGMASGGAASGGATSGGSGAIGGGAQRTAPVRRYSFDGVGTRVVDSMGGPDGTLVNTVLNDTGEAVLEGNDEYIDLPNHILTGLRSATFESWLSWDGGASWQRIFDFGEDETGQDGSRSAPPRDYFFFTVLNRRPANQGGPVMRVTYMKPGGNEIILDAPTAFPISAAAHHVAVVLDADNQALRLYLDGEHQESVAPFTASLADIYDINNWLGRSQYTPDPSLSGRYLEFRIYDVALTPNQVEQSYAAGPDASFQ